MIAVLRYYLYNKYMPELVKQEQNNLYHNLFLPNLRVIIQAELVGLPVNPDEVARSEQELITLIDEKVALICTHPRIGVTESILRRKQWEKDFDDRQAKAKNPDKIVAKDWETYPAFLFNPNSNLQLQTLLYDVMQLPILETTKKGAPSTGGDILKALKHHCASDEDKALLDHLRDFADADKTLGTFISAFKKAIPGIGNGHFHSRQLQSWRYGERQAIKQQSEFTESAKFQYVREDD